MLSLRIHRFTASLIIFLAATPWATCLGDGDPSVDAICTAWESSARQIASGDLLLNVTQRTLLDLDVTEIDGKKIRTMHPLPKPDEQKWRVHYTFDGEKQRVEMLPGSADVSSKPTWTGVWDGEQWKQLEIRFGVIQPDPGNNQFFRPFGLPYSYIYRYAEGVYTYTQLIRDRDSVIERDGNLVKIKSPGKSGFDLNLTDFTFWLDPAKGMMPVRLERGPQGKGIEVRLENDIEEVQPGVWAPVRTFVQSFVLDPTSAFAGKAYGTTEQIVDKGFSRFEIPVDAKTFVLEFPAGMEIHDRIRGMTYVSGRSKVENHLDDLAMQGRAGLNELAQVVPPMSEPTSLGLWSFNVILWLNIGLVVAIAAGWMIRKRVGSSPEAQG